MSERRRRYSIHEVGRPGPIIEERRPERTVEPARPKRIPLIFQFNRPEKQRKRNERAPSPVRYTRPRAPTPPPRFNSPPLLDTMPPKAKETPAVKPFVPLPKPLPVKKDDKIKPSIKPISRSNSKSGNKPKDEPPVKIYKGHRTTRSFDTGYASGGSSPWSIEDRSPLDYTYNPKRKSGVDKESYEIITGTSTRRYPKITTDRTQDQPTSTERKKDVRFLIRSPDSPGEEDEYIPMPVIDSKKDSQARVVRTTKVLQEQLAKESETARHNYEAARKEEAQRLAQIEALETELRKMRLERQLAEGRAAEAERKLKQQQIEELERREKELKQQQADEQKRREEDITRREAELREKQWREIESTPAPALQRRSTAPIEPEPKSRRNTGMIPYGSSESTIVTQQPRTLPLDSPFLAPILEAQRDVAARRAREAEAERRSGTEVKETSRSARRRPRNDDRYT